MWLLFAATKANACVGESLSACKIDGYVDVDRSLAMKI
jgi:hypothetical protein